MSIFNFKRVLPIGRHSVAIGDSKYELKSAGNCCHFTLSFIALQEFIAGRADYLNPHQIVVKRSFVEDWHTSH